MSVYYEESGGTIYHGDCLAVMGTFAADRFATVITDPPYHLTSGNLAVDWSAYKSEKGKTNESGRGHRTGFMGKAWDGGDIAFRPETWAAVLRVCKPGAMLLAFGGARTFHRLACAIEDAGWEIRDCIMWLYGSGFPKSLDISKAIDKASGATREVVGSKIGRPGVSKDGSNQARESWRRAEGREDRQPPTLDLTAPATDAARQWNGWGTSLKPAWEPIIVAMKPLDGTFSANALTHGVAGLNIDGARISATDFEPKDRVGAAKMMEDRPWQQRQQKQGRPRIIEGNSLGRWPANVLLDEAAAAMLNEQSGVSFSRPPGSVIKRASAKGGTASQSIGAESRPAGSVMLTHGDTGGASRFFYTAKASRSDRGHGNNHPTVKPTSLLKYLCTLTATPTGGEILDPFGGSMTTLVAARECGRPAVAIELDEGHCRIGIKRLSQGVLFGGLRVHGTSIGERHGCV